MKQFWKQMSRNPSGLIGLTILVIAVVLAVVQHGSNWNAADGQTQCFAVIRQARRDGERNCRIFKPNTCLHR